jgi:[acyl-carrier-protein] S-malonyltransferase
MQNVWLFPGQGAQHVGMARAALEHGGAEDLFQLAEQLAQEPLLKFLQHGPSSRLREPHIAELALTVVSLANARRWGPLLPPDAVAGYSAGETAALCAAGVLSEEDALLAAHVRGRALSRFVDSEAVTLAVSGLSAFLVRTIINGERDLCIIGFNTARDFSITGPRQQMTDAARVLRWLGANLSDVDIAGPWHTPGLEQAALEVTEQLRGVVFRAPQLPLFLSASGNSQSVPELIRASYAEQLFRPVLWSDIVHRLRARGISTWLDLGPGRALHGLLLRNFRGKTQDRLVVGERLPRPYRHVLGEARHCLA